MSEVTQIDEAARIRKRIGQLRRLRTRVDGQLRRLMRSPNATRPTWGPCLRCGHTWIGHWSGRKPRHCARCHSVGWEDTPLSPSARRPEDPPNPRWHKAIPRATKRQIAEKFLKMPAEDIAAHLPENIRRQVEIVTDNIETVLRIEGKMPGSGLPPPPPLEDIYAEPAPRPPAMSTSEVIERFMEGEYVAAPAVIAEADQAEEAARE